MWKCGNMSSLSLSNNSGSVEMWKCGNVEMWKCGNVELCLQCLYLITLAGRVEMWKCGNMSSLSLSNNSGSVEVWKCGIVEMWKYVFIVFA